MKKGIVLLSFFLVAFSLAANIVADVFLYSIELKLVEKEKEESGKESDHELDPDKEKIFPKNNLLINFLNSRVSLLLHPSEKTISSYLDTDINPPDFSLL